MAEHSGRLEHSYEKAAREDSVNHERQDRVSQNMSHTIGHFAAKQLLPSALADPSSIR
jgi:hypothetical protein